MKLALLILALIQIETAFAGGITGPEKPLLVDSDIHLVATDLTPGEEYVVRAETADKRGTIWKSWGKFQADKSGGIDFSTKPLAGSYGVAHSQGLWWSMRPVGDWSPAQLKEIFFRPDLTFSTKVTLEKDSIELSSFTFERTLLPDHLITEEFRSAELYGDLIYKEGSRGNLTVISLGGSEGGLSTGDAKLLADKGFTVLALAYHGVSPLPANLVEVPLEYAKNAIDFLKKHPAVNPEQIFVFGTSKGAEYSLALASTYKDITGVIARVPSGVVWQGLVSSGAELPEASSWSYRGKPLAYLPMIYEHSDFASPPFNYSVGYGRGLNLLARVPEAELPVENIRGPILLISGTDDEVWPSATLSDLIIKRLEKNNFEYEYTHLKYEGAGHFIGLPNWPTTGRVFGPMSAGGDQISDGIANHDSWKKIIEFLKRHE